VSIAQKPIVVIGSINIDLVSNADRIPAAGETITGSSFQTHHGGKGANQAVAAARLGYPVQMIGRVGDDAFGAQLRDGLKEAGVDTRAVAITPGSSGVAVILVAASGENSIVVVPGANAHLLPSDLEANIDIIRSAGIVLAQLEIPLETVLRLSAICEHEDVPFMLDPAPARPLPAELLRRVTWFTPNETEAAAFAHISCGNDNEKTTQLLMEQGIRGLVLKLGARGAYLAVGEGERHAIAPFPVKAVDTTAAGDCFNGVFAVALLSGSTPQQSARFAAAAAAISVTRPGAQPSMPTLAEVRAMLDAQP
jgi:ribokinase